MRSAFIIREIGLLHCRQQSQARRENHAPSTCRVNSRCSLIFAALAVTPLFISGCGTTRGYGATEQLVMSEAVDMSVSKLDFRPLTGRKVYLDTSYLRQVKGEGFVNSEYVTSALRQQVVAAGCLIQDSASESDVIIEARIGALGRDDHRVTFGIPENNALSAAAALIPGAPPLAPVPEIAFARRESREAAVKISAFAYDRNTRAPVWQSGVDRATATAKDTWVLGIGPFQGGSIRDTTKLAGSTISIGQRSSTGSPARFFDRPPVDYTAEIRYQQGWPVFNHGGLSADMIGVPESVLDRTQIAEVEPDRKPAEVATKPGWISDEDPENLQR